MLRKLAHKIAQVIVLGTLMVTTCCVMWTILVPGYCFLCVKELVSTIKEKV